MIVNNENGIATIEGEVVDDNVSELSFAEHMACCEQFSDKVNAILRTRFRKCEAFTEVTWEGQVQLKRIEMTNVAGPKGPIKIATFMFMPLPWALKDNALKATVEEQLNAALMKMEQSARQRCADMKALRLSFSAYAKVLSTVVATVQPNNSRIITP